MTSGGKVQLTRSTHSILVPHLLHCRSSLRPQEPQDPDCLSDADHSVLSRPNWQRANRIYCQSANTWPWTRLLRWTAGEETNKTKKWSDLHEACFPVSFPIMSLDQSSGGLWGGVSHSRSLQRLPDKCMSCLYRFVGFELKRCHWKTASWEGRAEGGGHNADRGDLIGCWLTGGATGLPACSSWLDGTCTSLRYQTCFTWREQTGQTRSPTWFAAMRTDCQISSVNWE